MKGSRNCSAYGLRLVSSGRMSFPDQSICVVNVVEPDGAGFVGIRDDNYVYVWCIAEFV